MLRGNNKTTNFLIISLELLIALLAGAGIFVMFSDCATQVVGKHFGTIISEEKEIQEILGSRQETLKFIGWLTGGVLAAIGVLMIGRRADAQVENNQLIEKGHIEERFRVATEHLATEHLATKQAGARIAAFYQFYYLAKESKDEDFRQNILDILCSHLRVTTGDPDYQKNNKAKPSGEIQLLLDILFKPKNKYAPKEDGKTAFRKLVPDLHGVYLVGADLNNAYLPQADFSDACLIGANMENAKLHKCIFTRTKMQGTNLYEAEMQLAIFDDTKLMGSNLRNADMRGAILEQEVYLQATYILDIRMQGVQFYGTNPPDKDHLKKQGLGFLRDNICCVFVGGTCLYLTKTPNFTRVILGNIGKESDIKNIHFSGGISKNEVKNTVKFLKKYIDKQAATEYQERMQKHIGKPLKKMTEEDCKDRIFLVPYDKRDADRWIAEYNEAMNPTPATENT